MTNKYIRHILKPACLFFLRFFFESKYIKGRYFDNSYSGFLWAFSSIWKKNILRLGRPYPWPTAISCVISNPDNIVFNPNDLHIFQVNGTYFQNFNAKIIIGEGTHIAQNTALITANHDLLNLDKHEKGEDIVIGKNCWIGANSVILPGVILGEGTIVGAGSIVTKSFLNSNTVIGGNPAKIIKELNGLPKNELKNHT